MGVAVGVSAQSLETERVSCCFCGEARHVDFVSAEDDLTGKPGRFYFVECASCGLKYQNPRIPIHRIGRYYDEEYIAHRKKTRWGPLTGFYNRVMEAHDRRKEAIVSRSISLDPGSRVLDVGCAVGSFLSRIHERYGCAVVGVDFKDLSGHALLEHVDFRHGRFCEQRFDSGSFDLITMWHYLEHDYDPLRTLERAADILKPEGRLIIEVPRLDSRTWGMYRERWPGLQAPQHTVLLDRKMLLAFAGKAGLEVIDYLPYGAFPAYFYVFAGAAFKLLRGRGLNLSRAIYPYFAGEILLIPLLLFEKRLNLAMQTVVCRRKR
jgi:2-polyprenyl-3-methyl-5-hydroxy-6-metoxy-1,4-benzoquinol methylase